MTAFDYDAALEGCARKDAASLRGLYRQEAGLLLAIARRIVRRREVAADVVHDAFVDIWERAGQFDPTRGSARVWLASIVRYRALKYVRSAAREADLDLEAQDAMQDDRPDPFARLASAQDAARLHGCLAGLPEERRRALLLAYVDGLTQSDIASRLGAPLGTVKAWMRRSLLALRECLA